MDLLGFPGSSVGKESACNAGRWFNSWVRKIPWRRDRLPTPVFLGFSCGLVGKESTCNVGDLGSIPGLGRSPGEGTGYPLQCSGLDNSMGCIIHGVSKSQTRLSDFHFHWIYSPICSSVRLYGGGRIQCLFTFASSTLKMLSDHSFIQKYFLKACYTQGTGDIVLPTQRWSVPSKSL